MSHACPKPGCGHAHEYPPSKLRPVYAELLRRLPESWTATRAEQTWQCALLDLLLGRDTTRTGSAGWIAKAGKGTEKGKTKNHSELEEAVVYLWSGGGKLRSYIIAQRKFHGALGARDETASPYRRLSNAAYLAALIHAGRAGDESMIALCREQLSRECGLLDHCEWRGEYWVPGLRCHHPELIPAWEDFAFHSILSGRYDVNAILGHRELADRPGDKNAAGYPEDLAIWLALLWQEESGPSHIEPIEPTLRWPIIREAGNSGCLFYFQRLGSGAAVELGSGTGQQGPALVAVGELHGMRIRKIATRLPVRFERGLLEVVAL